MYTQCPECKKYLPLTADLLRDSQGMVCCEACAAMYDALELLNEGDIPEQKKISDIAPPPEQSLTLETESKQQPTLYKIGIGFCLVCLVFQVYYFEGYNLTQNPTFRPWLEKTCQSINCRLPTYKNLDEISILDGSFEAIDDNSYLFKAAFINQSAFTQALPSIKLTLQDFTGQTFAKRIFHPRDYSKSTSTLIQPDISTEVIMSIAAPSGNIGGYHFQLK
ncbi:MAG: zinc-ribbon and DUF3426 domain-containing protein [Methylococcales bacterium]|nr:zinc-ribbon and DUF3426 domain-containing protein [Methylococcales bacterium]